MRDDIFITMDMDWADDVVIEDSLNLLASYNVTATLFMTNLANVDTGDHEVAIHPNFTSLDFERHIGEILNTFPDATGMRSHYLFYSSHFLALYERFGIEYQSNFLMHEQTGISPYKISDKVIEIPIYWMEFSYMLYHSAEPFFRCDDLSLSSRGLKVFDFHPIHVFLNTECQERYRAAKKYNGEPERLREFRNMETRGTRNLFIDLLEYISEKGIGTCTLTEIQQTFWKREERT